MTSQESIRLDAMEEKLNDMQTDVKQILAALKGDELGVDQGLIAEIKELKKRVLTLEAFKNKVIWVSIGAGISAGLAINKLIEWIQLSGK